MMTSSKNVFLQFCEFYNMSFGCKPKISGVTRILYGAGLGWARYIYTKGISYDSTHYMKDLFSKNIILATNIKNVITSNQSYVSLDMQIL